jgi:hypothetical protein
MSDINDKVNFLFKKFIGVPNTFNDSEYYSESVGNTRIKIFSNQILQQKIPETAPSDLTQDTTFVPLNGGGKRYCSILYPYIVKYENLVLDDINPLRSYKYTLSNNPTENLTNNAIPFNYDELTNTYDINIYDNLGSKILSSDVNYSWIFDGDVGCLYFVGPSDFIIGPPKITFWRYEGVIGLDNIASSTGGTTSSGTGHTGSKGDTGHTGSKGDTGPTGAIDYTLLSNYGKLDASNTWLGNNYFNATLDISDNSTRVATTQFVNKFVNSTIDTRLQTSDLFNKYLLNQPPPVVFDISSAIVTSYAIYFKFDYPTQLQAGFTTDLLPKINYLSAYYTNSNTNTQNIIINNETGPSYTKTSLNQTTPVVQGIVFVKDCCTALPSYNSPGNQLGTTCIELSNTIYPLKYGNDASNTLFYSYKIPMLNSLDISGNKLYVYYGNNSNTNFEYNPVTFNTFNNFDTRTTTAVTLGSISNTTEVSLPVDINLPYISGINVNVVSPYGSFIASILSYNQFTGILMVNNLIDISGVFTSAYFYNVSLDATSCGCESGPIDPDPDPPDPDPPDPPPPPPDPPPPGNPTLNNTTIGGPITLSGVTTDSVKKVTNLEPVSVILGSNSITTNNIYIPIQLQAQSASTATTIRTITSKITNNSVTVTGPSITFNGFSTPSQTLTTVGPTNGISLTSTQIGDVADISGGLTPVSTGYFLYAYITSQITSVNLVSSPYQYTFSVSDQQLAPNTLTSSYPYYYDSQPGNVALASGGSFSITNITTSYNVSGLKIFSSGTMNVSTSLSGVINIGKYFCNSGNIVTYTNTKTGTVLSSEPNFEDATGTSGGPWYLTDGNGQYINPNGITFTLANYSLTIPSTDTSFSITATINGIGSSESLTNTVTSNVLIDTNSFNLVYNTFKQSFAEALLSTTYINGYRIYSVADPSWNKYTTGNAIMSTIGYNNSISIADNIIIDASGNNYNTEMLVSKGGLITRGYDPSAFINYSSYYGNSFNYSTIASDTNMRYATFAWNCQRPASGTFGRLNLQITFAPGTTFTNSVGGYQVNGSNFILYYRIEDNLAGPRPPTAFSTTNVSSVWINGNTTTGTAVTSSNYYQITPTKHGSPVITGLGLGTGIATYKLVIPNTLTTGARAQTLYVKTGAQNSASFKITNIQAYLSPT